MTDENTEQSQAPVEENATELETSETLDDVIKQYNVEEQANQFASQPQQPQQPQQEYYDYGQPDLSPVYERMEKLENDLLKQSVENDIKSAVAKANEKADIDPSMMEVILETKYRNDPSFKKIWDARSHNPKALEKALGIIGQEASSKFSVKTDPQLVENQKAAQASQKTMANAPKEDSITDKMMDMSDGDFDRMWSQLKGH